MDKQVSETGERSNRIGNDVRSQLLAMIPATERKLNLAGVSTAVLEGGRGDPLVLLHGPGEYAAKWLRVIPDLVRTHRVIAPDLPGHGESAGIEGSFDPARVLSWLDELIETTCPTPPILVGQILGGAIAARYASSYSDRIRCLILADALGLASFQPRPVFGEALQEFIMDPNEKAHDRFWDLCAYNLHALRDSLGQKWTLIKSYNLNRAGEKSLQATQHKLFELFGLPAIPPEELERILVPTVLIWGRHDLATNVDVAGKISTQYGWPLHVIENAADDPPLEQPEAFLEVLRNAIVKLK